MKALTVKQPFASLIAAGIKDVENRSWRTAYRGPLLIHAGLTFDSGRLPVDVDLAALEFPRGAIIAQVDLVDCVRDSDSEWAIRGEWHWVLRNVQPVELEPCRGSLGLWNHGPANPAQLMLEATL